MPGSQIALGGEEACSVDRITTPIESVAVPEHGAELRSVKFCTQTFKIIRLANAHTDMETRTLSKHTDALDLVYIESHDKLHCWAKR